MQRCLFLGCLVLCTSFRFTALAEPASSRPSSEKPESDFRAERFTAHWAFQPVTRPALPTVDAVSWVRSPVDRFVLSRLEAEQIKPSPEADRATLMRRVYLDLIGLPPTPDEVAAFLAEDRPNAYERLVDRLLASPHYGERWGRYWLDLARYADSDGYEKDRPRPNAWRYRQWVLDALNEDLPFDSFSTLQIAGDLLGPQSDDAHIASGFHRNTMHNTEGGIDPEEDRTKKTVDRTNTVGTIWLGLTVGCAQCHTHKYDPLSHHEYYSLYAFFNNMDEAEVAAPSELELVRHERAVRRHQQKLAEYEQALRDYERDKLSAAQKDWETTVTGGDAGLPAEIAAIVNTAADARTREQQKVLAEHYRTLDSGLLKLEKQLQEHIAAAPTLAAAVANVVRECEQPRETFVHLRGDFLSPGDQVTPAVPAILPPLANSDGTIDRVDLARWLFRDDHPLTARVTANRIWQRYFTRGLVATSDDFGLQGERPSHPRLLDYLARELREGGWSLKRLHRLIVTSATYRQSSAIRTDLVDKDPENVLLARQTRRRVDAELVRDMALASSGLLDPRVGGPSVRPPQPADYDKLTYANSAKWTVSEHGDARRRGLYTFFQRTSPYPMLMTFDATDSTECVVKRARSNTPLQALTLWNDTVFFECAQALGRRITAEVPTQADARSTARERAAYAVRLCLNRTATADELQLLLDLYQQQYQGLTDTAQVSALVGAESLPKGSSAREVAAWISIGRTLLNLDEFVTRE